MATLHFIGGEKGGTGKSLVTSTITQYHLDRRIKFALFDADRHNPDVKRAYGKVGCQEAILSEKEKYEDKADSLYSEAKKKTTIVNLPPNVGIPLKDWLEENDLFEIAEEDGVKFTHWFICSGVYNSVKLLDEYLTYFKRNLNHVLVKNWGLSDEWDILEGDNSLMSKIQDYQVKIIDFPELIGAKTRNFIEAKNLTLGAAREEQELNLFEHLRIRAFLDEAYQRFDDAEVFNDEGKREEQVG